MRKEGRAVGEVNSALARAEREAGDEIDEGTRLPDDIREIVNAFGGLYDMAYDAYLPLVEDICSRDASENEVEYLLDYLLNFAGEDRLLALYKRVCRNYFYRYPDMVAAHIYLWRDMYDDDYEEQQWQNG